MVVKVNISIAKDILEKLDAAARESKTSRSAFMALAVKHFLAQKEEEKEKERRMQAAKAIDSLREKYGPWDGTAEVLKWRSKH